MICPHCSKPVPEKGYCCERLELETLRAVADDVASYLDTEVVAAQSIGAIDAVEPITHASARLKIARGHAA